MKWKPVNVVWLKLEPDPCPPELSEGAKHFAVEPKTRDCYIDAVAAGLDIGRQFEAIASEAVIFHNVFGPPGKIEHPYVSIDYLLSVPDLPIREQLLPLKAIVLEQFDRSDSESEEDV